LAKKRGASKATRQRPRVTARRPAGRIAARPLASVRVLDLSRLLPGPFASLLLSDLGAAVDRLDDASSVDYLRFVPPMHACGESARFVLLNRGKRSVSLNLRSERGRQAFLKLLGHYDVLIEQFRPGVLEKVLGTSLNTIQTTFPHLIVCSISGFGQTGVDAQRAGHDLTYLARAGVLGLSGPGIPQVPAGQNADVLGALYAVIAIQGALAQRSASGRGTHVEVSLTEAVMTSLAFSWGATLAGSSQVPGGEILTGGIAPYRVYETQDGRYVALAALEPKFWLTLNAALGMQADLEDLAPGPHQVALMARWERIFKSRSLDAWRDFGREYDVCLEPVLTPDEVLADAHLNERAVFPDRETGEVALNTPVSARARRHLAAAPKAGEHTRKILKEAGFSAGEIKALTDVSSVPKR
jgi:alpha-methylacyl-CoA racemase